jgi:uncharacterized protein YbjT (DUF2867 family)
MRIAITTPTGHIGRRLVEILQGQGGNDLVLLARDPGKLTDETARGATVVQGDLNDAAYVLRATAGADALFAVMPPNMRTDDLRGTANAIAQSYASAVRTNHIERVVLVSSIGAHLGTGTGPITGLHDAEQMLRKAAPTLTILRPGYFMENFMMALETIAHAQAIYLPVRGETRLPMIATRDIAEAAARALTDTTSRETRIMPLHGPRDYSFNEATEIIAGAVGHPVRLVTVTAEQARQQLREHGVSDSVAESFLEMYDAFDSGRVRPEIPRSAETTTRTTFEEFAGEVLVPALKAMEQHV